jgi:hypothetical protein
VKITFASVLFCIVSFGISVVQAYPDFIGYGYSSCITCHYNGNGGGALNDYGRALFATEIASRSIYKTDKEEEAIGAESGFLGKKELPWWIRPGLKYRGLWFQSSPGSSQKREMFINMQADINLALMFDKQQKFVLVTTTSYNTYPRAWSTSTENKTTYWFEKEYYLRWQYSKTFWVYLGQMDKVFGIRQIDHTAYSRIYTGLSKFDQSQEAILHWTYPDWDTALNLFVGNGDEEAKYKQKGASVSGEYQVAESFKVGASGMYSKSEIEQWTRVAGHSRLGLSKGTSLLSEVGLFQNTPVVASPNPIPTGAYVMLETLANITRGYNILSTVEYAKTDIKRSATEKLRWSFGTLMFPLPRTELRLMAVEGKSYDDQTSTSDSWQLQTQLHLSF